MKDKQLEKIYYNNLNLVEHNFGLFWPDIEAVVLYFSKREARLKNKVCDGWKRGAC